MSEDTGRRSIFQGGNTRIGAPIGYGSWMPSLDPPMRRKALVPQGDSCLCWAAALVCAARYHRYPRVRRILGAEDLNKLVWRERRGISIAASYGPSERGRVSKWRAGRPQILQLALALGVNCEPIKPADVGLHIAKDNPVIAQWTPTKVYPDQDDEIVGGHFGVICSWTAARVRITDSLHKRPGEAPGTRAIPRADFEPAMGTRSLIAVLPP